MSKIKITETISDTPYSQVAYCYLNDVKAVLKTKKETIITNSIRTELKDSSISKVTMIFVQKFLTMIC